jgi:hypothetical protein
LHERQIEPKWVKGSGIFAKQIIRRVADKPSLLFASGADIPFYRSLVPLIGTVIDKIAPETIIGSWLDGWASGGERFE